MALIDEIQQPSRRRHQEIDAAGKRLALRPVRDAADDDRMAELEVPAIGGDAVADLNGQLTRRRQNERTGPRRPWPPARFGEMLQQRQHEGRRLAGAGLGNADQIPVIEQRRNRLHLNGRGHVVALGFERAQERRRQAKR